MDCDCSCFNFRNFHRPLGLRHHLRWCVWRRQDVMSSKNDGTNPWQLPFLSAAKHQSRSLKRKIGSFAQYLSNFSQSLGFPGHLWWCFWCREHVISSKSDGANQWQLLLLSALEHQSPPSPFRNFVKYLQFCMLISLSILRNTISYFA